MKGGLRFDQDELSGCCGVRSIYNLDIADKKYSHESDIRFDLGNLATTIPEQRNEIKRLKALGFKRLRRFKRIEYFPPTWITLWFRGPSRYKPRALIEDADNDDTRWDMI